MYRHLNEESAKKKSSLNWIWENGDDGEDENSEDEEAQLAPIDPPNSSGSDDSNVEVLAD